MHFSNLNVSDQGWAEKIGVSIFGWKWLPMRDSHNRFGAIIVVVVCKRGGDHPRKKKNRSIRPGSYWPKMARYVNVIFEENWILN